MTLDEWMDKHREPRTKPYKLPAPGKMKPKHDLRFKLDAAEYQFHVNLDRRTIHGPVTLEEFLELKRNPNQKPYIGKVRSFPKVCLSREQEREERAWVIEYVKRSLREAA